MDAPQGFRLTLTELIVGLVVLGVLAVLVLPQAGSGGGRPASTQMLSTMKQLHLATQQMALDGTTTGDTSLGWPGTNSFASWASNLVPSYLSTNDFIKLLSVPPDPEEGYFRKKWRSWWASPPLLPAANTNAILVYQVSEQTDGNVVFLSSANFANTPSGGALKPAVAPLGAKCFVVFRKGGDGAVFLAKQIGDTNAVGVFVPLLP